MLVHFSKKQIDVFADARLDGWQRSVVTILRDCFPARMQPHPDATIVALCQRALRDGADQQLTSEADLTRYVIAAALLGAGFMSDWQHNWLFNEHYGTAIATQHDSYNLITLLSNLERAVNEGRLQEEPLLGFQARCRQAEALTARPAGGGSRSIEALSWLDGDKVRWLGRARLERFIAECMRRAAQHAPAASTRYLLLAWLFGHDFIRDPLCDSARTFLKQATTSTTHGS